MSIAILKNMEPNHLVPAEKVEAILAGAMQEFLTHGFAATTMDRVSAAAGVSKTTVYSHFQDKEGLFTALIQQLVREKDYTTFHLLEAQFMPEEASVILHKLALSILKITNIEQPWLAFTRLIIGESGRFPNLAKAFVNELEKSCLDDLTQFLTSRTELNLPDPEATARIFIGTLVHFLIIQELLHGKDIVPMAPDRLVDNLIYFITINQTKSNSLENRYSGTRQKSSRRNRKDSGKFELDYDEPKRLRSIRLTDTAWDNLAAIAAENQMTRTEVIEIFARNGK